MIVTHISLCKNIPLFTDFHGFEGSTMVMSYLLSSYRHHPKPRQPSHPSQLLLSRRMKAQHTSTKTLFNSTSATDCPRHLKRPYPKINSWFRSIWSNWAFGMSSQRSGRKAFASGPKMILLRWMAQAEYLHGKVSNAMLSEVNNRYSTRSLCRQEGTRHSNGRLRLGPSYLTVLWLGGVTSVLP